MKVSMRSLAIVFLSTALVLGGLQSARAGDSGKSDEKAAEAAAEKRQLWTGSLSLTSQNMCKVGMKRLHISSQC